MPVLAHHRFDGGALTLRREASVRHEQNGVAVVLQARMNAGEVSLGQFDQLILVLARDGFPARTRNVSFHVAAFPFAAAFICFLYDRTCPSERASTISATDT